MENDLVEFRAPLEEILKVGNVTVFRWLVII